MSLVMVSFFGEGLFFHEDDLEKDEIDMREIYQKILESFVSILYPCFLEFFFANEYRQETEDKY